MRARAQFNSYLKPEYAQYIRDEAVAMDKPVGEVVEDFVDIARMKDLRFVLRRFIRLVSGRTLARDQRQYLERLRAEIDLVLAADTKAEPGA
jgi:hypothetical protein